MPAFWPLAKVARRIVAPTAKVSARQFEVEGSEPVLIHLKSDALRYAQLPPAGQALVANGLCADVAIGGSGGF